jgi:spore germination cell wall hydrolase CwlJ-like protein
MDFKSAGFIIVCVGGLILYNNSNTNQQFNKIETRLAAIEQKLLVQVPVKERNLPVSEVDVECMSRNIFYEAGIESELGKYAVAQVTVNRWQAKKPKSICQIIYAKAKVNDKYICQFSWACKGKLERPAGKNWEDSKRIAIDVLKHGMRLLPVKEASHYHADYVKPNWAEKERLVWVEGQHYFYAGAKVIFKRKA